MSILFKINTTDLSTFDYKPEHKVNRTDVFESWTDGNWIEHRQLLRTRISGQVTLRFTQPTDYSAFVALLTSERTADGYYLITVWCSNTNTSETLNAFLEVEGTTRWDVTTPRVYNGVTIKITGR